MGSIPNGKVEKELANAVFCQLTDQTVFSYEVVHINTVVTIISWGFPMKQKIAE
jgi:hypothetical protein